jgi:N-acetyl sugar amidotransferase
MDTTDADIRFDENGVCNHCHDYERVAKRKLFSEAEARLKLNQIVDKIKNDGQGKEYDCIIGLSGGVDSSYLALQAKKMGLRPLAIHFDNGWNSELSVKNIENIVKTLGFDLYTYVIDWEEFRDLQVSFFKASVIDIEVLTDNAIFASLYKIARERNIHYLLNGQNIVTEAVMPKSWVHMKSDLKNIRAIQKRFGSKKIKSFPTISPWKMLYYQVTGVLKPVCLLDYLPYNKTESMKTLEDELGWRYYGGKHYESIFTKFYQAYVLPVKFNVDKRKAHLSSLICSGQMTREEALTIMEEQLYPTDELRRDREYVIKKLGLSEGEFEQIMKLPVRSHLDYPSSAPLYAALERTYRKLKRR